MPKDSQLDPKHVRREKAKGGSTLADDALDGEGRNQKKQSGGRRKPGSDRCTNQYHHLKRWFAQALEGLFTGKPLKRH